MPGNSAFQGIIPSATPAPIHDIIDARGVMLIPSWLFLLILLLLLAGLVSLVWWFLSRRRQGPPLSPQAKAIAALASLQAENLTAYEYALKISAILRSYLEEAFGLRAVSATSLEFLENIRNHPLFTSEERASLREFLELADLIKFARVEASSQELQKLFQAAETFVRKPLFVSAEKEAVRSQLQTHPTTVAKT